MSNAGESPALNGNVRNVPPQGFSFIGFTLPQSATAVNAWMNGISRALCRMPYSDRRPLHSASPISHIEVTQGNISTIHSYNRRKVTKEDVPKYGRAVGTGTLVIGVSLVLSYLITFWNEAAIDYIVLPAMIVGLAFILYGQIKYNHGIF